MKCTNLRKKKLNIREYVLYDLVCMQLRKAKVIYSVISGWSSEKEEVGSVQEGYSREFWATGIFPFLIEIQWTYHKI